MASEKPSSGLLGLWRATPGAGMVRERALHTSDSVTERPQPRVTYAMSFPATGRVRDSLRRTRIVLLAALVAVPVGLAVPGNALAAEIA